MQQYMPSPVVVRSAGQHSLSFWNQIDLSLKELRRLGLLFLSLLGLLGLFVSIGWWLFPQAFHPFLHH
jgi:hypothetical protein